MRKIKLTEQKLKFDLSKRFWVFECISHYPHGALDDIIHTVNSLEEAKKYCEDGINKGRLICQLFIFDKKKLIYCKVVEYGN